MAPARTAPAARASASRALPPRREGSSARAPRATSARAAEGQETVGQAQVIAERQAQRLARKAARQSRRKDEIVNAAAALAATAGLDGITAEDVARALHMSTPSVFYYFPGGLLELRAAVALRRFYARMDDTVKSIERAPTGIAALTGWIRGYIRTYAADPEGFGMDLEVMQRGSWGPELVQLHIEKLNALFTVVEKKLEVDRAAGRLHPDIDNLRRLALLMNQLALGLVAGDQLRRKVGGGSKHALDALAEDLCAILERGVQRTPAARARGAPR